MNTQANNAETPATPATAATTATTTTTLRAQGFSCPSCVGKIEKQVEQLSGVESVTVHFASGRVVVAHDANQAPVDLLVEAVAKAGYQSAPAAF